MPPRAVKAQFEEFSRGKFLEGNPSEKPILYILLLVNEECPSLQGVGILTAPRLWENSALMALELLRLYSNIYLCRSLENYIAKSKTVIPPPPILCFTLNHKGQHHDSRCSQTLWILLPFPRKKLFSTFEPWKFTFLKQTQVSPIVP